jgi:stress-induced morphogen
MSNETAAPEWEHLRTEESRRVEDVLREEFAEVDAYRFNSASLRIRVNDSRFEGLSREQREELIEPVLSTLSEETQADIMNLVLLYPGETGDSFQAFINNEEFEHPSRSML